MNKFTPGPWKAVESSVAHCIYIQEMYIKGNPKGEPAGNICTVYGNKNGDVSANARLIAAAPEMYKLLKEELIPTSEHGGILSFSREKKVRDLLTRIDEEDKKMTEELKPCPFCGGKAHITDCIPSRLYVKDTAYCVYCATCGLLLGFDMDYGGEFATEQEAIEAWNRRAGND